MPLLTLCLLLASCGESAPAPDDLAGTANMVAAEIVARGKTFPCTPTRVWDGDGPIWCAEGPRLRLAGINAREMDGSCLPNAPCVEASGEQAKAALVAVLGGSRGTTREGHAMVAGPLLRCTSNGSAGRERTGAACILPDGRSLSCAMLATRTVARWSDYNRARRLVGC